MTTEGDSRSRHYRPPGTPKRPPLHADTNSVDQLFPGSDYTDEERLFLQAMDRFKRTRRRPFPSWSEVLSVVISLGYRKVAEPGPLPQAGRDKETT
jgi:hypothetical protein